MAYKLNPFTGEFDFYQEGFLGVSSSAPSGSNGNTYINSGDSGYYVYYDGTWQLLATLSPSSVSKILLETGDGMLLETGDFALLES